MCSRLARFGFKGCVGFIDGTTIPLSQRPGEDDRSFFDRKHRSIVNSQVVCDDRRRITAFYYGWPGSCTESTVYTAINLASDVGKVSFFASGEYLLVDSAYPTDLKDDTLVPSYNSNMKGKAREDFNTCVGHVRVVNEHTIGVLKGRWGL